MIRSRVPSPSRSGAAMISANASFTRFSERSGRAARLAGLSIEKRNSAVGRPRRQDARISDQNFRPAVIVEIGREGMTLHWHPSHCLLSRLIDVILPELVAGSERQRMQRMIPVVER